MTDVASFAELFSLAEYTKNGIYWHASGAASYCWLAHPMSAEHLSGIARHHIANDLGMAIGMLPGGSTVQFILTNIDNIDWALANYQKNGNGSHRWLRQFENAKMASYKQWTRGMTDTVGLDVRVKDIQVLIVLTVYEYQDQAMLEIGRDALDALTRPQNDGYLPPLKTLAAHKRTQQQCYAMHETIMSARQTLEKAFTAVKLPRLQCRPEALVRFTRKLIDPVDGGREPVNMDPELYLHELVCRKRVETGGKGKFINCDSTHQVMLYAESWPKHSYAGHLTLDSDALEDHMSPIDLLRDGVLCVNMRVVEKNEADAWLEVREKMTGKGGSEAVEDKEIFQHLSEAKEWTKNQNRRMVDVSITLKVNGASEHEASQRAREIQATFQNLQFGFRIEDTDALTLWCEQLPGGFHGIAGDGGARTRRRRDILAGALTPLFMSGRGTKNFVSMFMNEHYEPYAFNNFDHPSSFNVAFTGEPGSGKSGRINDIVMDMGRSDDHRTFIVDFGGSYGPTTSIFDQDGLDVGLSLERQQPCNVFAGPADVTIPILLDWLPGLALNPGEHLDPVVKSHIEGALRAAYRKRLRPRQPYKTFDEIPKRYPNLYPTNARKRFFLEYLLPADMQRIEEMQRGDEQTRPRFTVFYCIRLKSFAQKGGGRRETPKLSSIDKQLIDKLNTGYRYVEEDEDGPYVLATKHDMVDSLAGEGWVAAIDDRWVIAEAQRIDDFKQLMACAVSVMYDEAWISEQEKRVRGGLVARFGPGHAKLEQYVAEEMKALNPEEYFNWLDGEVDLQEEITFSDFIRETKIMQDSRLNDFITRLSMWHGDGIYAEVFDRRGGVDLSKYRIVVWDFKPVFKAEKRFVTALLGAVLLRIQVFCDSITNMHLRKAVIVDEFNQFTTLGDQIVSFVNTLTLQARKSGYCAMVGTQKFEHLAQVGLVDQFQFYFIGSQLPSSIRALKDHLGFTEEQQYIAARACMVPGRYSDFLLFCPKMNICEIVRSVQSSFEYWLRTTYNKERTHRLLKIQKFQKEFGMGLAEATIQAVTECSKEFPRGMRAAQTTEIV